MLYIVLMNSDSLHAGCGVISVLHPMYAYEAVRASTVLLLVGVSIEYAYSSTAPNVCICICICTCHAY